MPVTFDQWVSGRAVRSLATNSGSKVLAFQNWRKFKEAFAPELVAKAIQESTIKVNHCLDPFGGSGTTALACQFLGVTPHTFEVNPYLADLIEAKLSTYDPSQIASDFCEVLRNKDKLRQSIESLYGSAPRTLIEPGKNDRWIFPRSVAQRIAGYRIAIEELDNPTNARLFKALLGGILVEVSNVIISGKGRRYRRDWQNKQKTASDVDRLLLHAVEGAIGDIVRHAERRQLDYFVSRGDARHLLDSCEKVDLVIFSPPYPNSFDYTDVYNLELWMLGYIKDFSLNKQLRLQTLSSHVQIGRTFSPAPKGSRKLRETLSQLETVKSQLWDPRIPQMVGAYFADMLSIMKKSAATLPRNGEIWMIVGDSKYANTPIPVADVLCELAATAHCITVRKEPFRSMRSSAQQGGREELAESLIVLRRV